MTHIKSNNGTIAKNTIMLYIRMGITMIVQLYTSRVILEILGIQNYGIWNLVASIVISISFITGPLSSATQRFLSFEIGKRNKEKTNLIFSQSIIIYLIFCIILLILFETIGLWLLNYKLTIPEGMNTQVNIVYQLSTISFIVTIIRMPYDSLIIAKEEMKFYAYVSIIEVVMKLLIVFAIPLFQVIPCLISYAFLTLIVSILTTLSYKYYCNTKYKESHIHFIINKSVIRDLASFSGWNLFGAFAVMTSNQGINIVLNYFFGVMLNATMGITNQVSNAVNQFVTNFQIAFQPQIIKRYARSDTNNFYSLIYKASRFSFLLLFTFAFPIIININDILIFWLGNNVPLYTQSFCFWIICSLLIDCLSAPLWMSISANGNIKYYQITIGIVMLVNVILSYFALSVKFPPVSVVLIKLGVSILSLIVRLLFSSKICGLSIIGFIKNVIGRILGLLIIVLIPYMLISTVISINSHIINIIIHALVFWILYLFGISIIGLTSDERSYCYQRIKRIIL